MTTGAATLADAHEPDEWGRALAAVLRAGDVVALSGTLGAGKTSLVRGLLAGLGLADEAPSPSFALVIAYAPPEVRLPLAHVDLYRLRDADEVEELGLDDALLDSALAIEWPERMGAKAWPQALRLYLATAGTGRRLTWDAPAAWEGRWPPPLRR